MRKIGFSLLLFLAFVYVVFLVILGAGFVYTSSSYFCASCHEMSTQYVSWRRSAHSDVACMSCHSEPGIIGEIKSHLQGSKFVFFHLTRMYSRAEIHAEVKDTSCLVCHRNIKEKDKESGYIHIQHEGVKASCVTCHAGLVHGDLGGGFLYQKEACDNCHLQLEHNSLPQAN